MTNDGRKLRITLLTFRPILSGGARVIADYAGHLLRRGHDVRVFAQPEAPPLLRRLKARLRGAPAWKNKPSPYFEPLGDRFIRLPRVGPPRAHELPDADVIVANFWITANWLNDLPASKGAKAYFMQDYGAGAQPIEEVRKTWSLGLKMITISRYLQNEIARVSGAPSLLVPNGVDPAFIVDQPRAPRSGPPTVGFVFSTNPMKGSAYCIEAIRRARESIPDLRAVAFGPKQPADAAAIPSFIEFKANVSEAEAGAIYASCDAWLFGTIREGFGLPILEAMAARTPVIAAASAAAPDILAHGGGRLVPVENAEAMAAAIVDVCRLEGPEWRALSDSAFETSRRYSLDAARTNFEEALIAIADGRFDAMAAAGLGQA